jgi:hypothetical protein
MESAKASRFWEDFIYSMLPRNPVRFRGWGRTERGENKLCMPAVDPAETMQILFGALANVPALSEGLKRLQREISEMREEIRTMTARPEKADGWIDAREAAEYMGLSAGSFDKYRYTANPKIKGYKLDGKTLYKRSDLDSFIKLYELRSHNRLAA